ncbi:MAG: DUF1501 domain-containing protein [Pseudomonadota bacterium]
MDIQNLKRRRFLQAALGSACFYGLSGLSPLSQPSFSMAAPLNKRLLLNLFMDGGPDMRHLVVPAFDSTEGSLGAKYWQHRARSHSLAAAGQTAQQRWNDDYEHFTVAGAGWPSGLVDIDGLNAGVTFGIWKEASWLIDMFRAGHVAMVFNAVGGQDRAHDLSTLILNQGNVLSGLNDQNRSGWGGRLARSALGNAISVARTPSPFLFGPAGVAPSYNNNAVDNTDLISVADSRELGLADFDVTENQFYNYDQKLMRAGKTYYASLRSKPGFNHRLEKFLQHEEKTRLFGQLIQGRLESVPIPNNILGLYDEAAGLNLDPANANEARRVLHRGSFGEQIRNAFDVIASNDLLNPTVLSMEYGGWDSHGDQREVPGILATDPNNPDVDRGIEHGLRDIFGGQFGSSPNNAAALHYGFSALWNNLSSVDRNNIVVTVAGEFGRQIRDNGNAGTDHGKGNLMLVISERCNGGIYGQFSQADELAKYDQPPNRTPDITPRTEIDHLFSAVSEWVQPGSSTAVFPRTANAYSGEAPIIESAGMFDSLMVD